MSTEKVPYRKQNIVPFFYFQVVPLAVLSLYNSVFIETLYYAERKSKYKHAKKSAMHITLFHYDTYIDLFVFVLVHP